MRHRKLKIATALFFLLVLIACRSQTTTAGENKLFEAPAAESPAPPASAALPESEPEIEIDEVMTAPLKKQIAQMLLVGFRGTELDPGSALFADIAERGLGGVIVFDYDMPSRSPLRNVTSQEQLAALCSALKAAARSAGHPPLFVGIDQEGGRVSRLRQRNGFPPTQEAAELAAADLAEGAIPGEATRAAAESTAALLAEMGINVNFAPCVDLNINPKNPIIGKVGRSFSADPEVVVRHAALWINAHSGAGVYSCIKHFPGHGSSSADTHRGAVDVSGTWREEELLPYRALLSPDAVSSGLLSRPLRFVMTSHVFNGRLDRENPATLSKLILTDLLRGEIGFDGLVVSDDIDMKAIRDNYAFDAALVKAVNAGVDIVCLSNNGDSFDEAIAEKAIAILYDAVLAGEIPPARIYESYARILKTKAALY